MIKNLFLIFMIFMLTGCATIGIRAENFQTEHLDAMEISVIEPLAPISWVQSLFGFSMPAGDFEFEFSENRKAKVSTKKDMKLLDFNLSKVGEE